MAMTTSAIIVSLLSGAIGAFLSTIVLIIFTARLDRSNKRWALKAELRRHRVERLISANDTVRKCFYQAWTQLQFHLVAVEDLEAELNTSPLRQLEIKNRSELELARYNSVVGEVRANARTSVALLDSKIIPADVITHAKQVLQRHSVVFPSNSASIKERIQAFNDSEVEVLSLLAQIDQAITDEISKELP